MLPKQNRTPRRLFRPIIEEGKYFNSPHFSLKAAKASEKARFAVSVSKKISKKASDRNKIRRRVYSALKDRKVQNGLYLIIAKSGAEGMKGEALKKELDQLFSKL